MSFNIIRASVSALAISFSLSKSSRKFIFCCSLNNSNSTYVRRLDGSKVFSLLRRLRKEAFYWLHHISNISGKLGQLGFALPANDNIKAQVCCKLSRNQPTGLYFLIFAVIQTCTHLYPICVTSLHKDDEFELIGFFMRNIFHVKQS